MRLAKHIIYLSHLFWLSDMHKICAIDSFEIAIRQSNMQMINKIILEMMV